MFTVRRIQRSAIVCALLCAALVPALSSTSAAKPSDSRQAPAIAQQHDLRSPAAREASAVTDPFAQQRSESALAQERYYSSHGNPDSGAALAQERYYSSHGSPAPLTVPQSPAPSDGTSWLSIVLGVAGALAIVAASADQLRRLRIRRRRAARIAI